MPASFLPQLFASGRQGRAQGLNLLDSALNRSQRGSQYRLGLRERRREAERQREAQREAQDQAFTNSLITTGISTAAGAAAGGILSSAAQPAVDATAKTATDAATSPIIADAVPVVANAPTPPTPIGFDSPELAATVTPPTVNPTVTRPSPGPRVPSINTQGLAQPGQVPTSGPLQTASPGTGIALGALSGLTGQNYLAPYLATTARAPLRNAQFGLDVARNETLRGLDLARVNTEAARQRDIEADTARTRYLTPLEGYTELGAGAKNFADANQTNALTGPKAFKERTAGFANRQRGLKSMGDNRRSQELHPGEMRLQGLEIEGQRFDNKNTLLKNKQLGNNQPPNEEAFLDIVGTTESRARTLKDKPEQVNAIFDQFFRQNRKWLTPEQTATLMNDWYTHYGYLPESQRGKPRLDFFSFDG